MWEIELRGSWNGINFPCGKLQDPLRNNFPVFKSSLQLNRNFARNCRNFQDPLPEQFCGPEQFHAADRNNLPHFRPFQVKIKPNSRNCGHFRPHPPHASTSCIPHACCDLSCGRDDLPPGKTHACLVKDTGFQPVKAFRNAFLVSLASLARSKLRPIQLSQLELPQLLLELSLPQLLLELSLPQLDIRWQLDVARSGRKCSYFAAKQSKCYWNPKYYSGRN